MYNSKRGSISLSINMIVVVVLAFVMLGLMLGLGRNIIKNAEDMSSQVSEQTRQDIVNKLSESSEPLYFTQREFDVSFKDRLTLMFGVKNTRPASKDLKVEIFYVDPTTGNPDPIKATEFKNYGKFQWDVGLNKYSAGEGKPFDVKYWPNEGAGNAGVGTFQFKFRVIDPEEDNPVAEQNIFINVIS